jgi:hypothetical protein
MRLFVALAVFVVLLSAARMVSVPTIVEWWQTLPSNSRLLYLAGFSYHPTLPPRTKPPPKINAAPAKTHRQSVNRQKPSKSEPAVW